MAIQMLISDLLANPRNVTRFADDDPDVARCLRLLAHSPAPPIVLDSIGVIMDGRHRVAAAIKAGYKTIQAMRCNDPHCRA